MSETGGGVKRHRLLNYLAAVTVISLGLVTVMGLLIEDGPSDSVAAFLLQLVSVTAAVAVVVGVLNLVAVHLGRFVRSEHGWPYSILVLLSMVAVIVLRILDRAEIWSGDLEGEVISERVFEAVQVSAESALAAILLFFLVYAAYRLMRDRVTVWQLVFTLSALVMLVGWIPLESLDFLADAREWLVRVPVSAGARGILIGVGLGTVTVGVRVLMGQDRAFRE